MKIMLLSLAITTIASGFSENFDSYSIGTPIDECGNWEGYNAFIASYPVGGSPSLYLSSNAHGVNDWIFCGDSKISVCVWSYVMAPDTDSKLGCMYVTIETSYGKELDICLDSKSSTVYLRDNLGQITEDIPIIYDESIYIQLDYWQQTGYVKLRYGGSYSNTVYFNTSNSIDSILLGCRFYDPMNPEYVGYFDNLHVEDTLQMQQFTWASIKLTW